jgi:hypothetical protein
VPQALREPHLQFHEQSNKIVGMQALHDDQQPPPLPRAELNAPHRYRLCTLVTNHVHIVSHTFRHERRKVEVCELRVGDVWTERPQQRAARTYRVIEVASGLAPTTMRVTGECVTTGQRRTTDFFLVNRIEVHERHAETSSYVPGQG